MSNNIDILMNLLEESLDKIFEDSSSSGKVAELKHYASPYYDPVKAHEYYMRTRELKGRRKASTLNEEGKKAWQYTRSNISDEKKQVLKTEREKNKQTIKDARNRAKDIRKKFSEELKKRLTRLSEEAKNNRSGLSEIAQDKIERLMSDEIPKGLPKEQRAKLMEERRKKIQRIRENTQSEKEDIGRVTNRDKKLLRESSKEQRTKLSEEVKSVITATREAYKKFKEDTNASYEEIYQREFDKIASEYKRTKKAKKSKK